MSSSDLRSLLSWLFFELPDFASLQPMSGDEVEEKRRELLDKFWEPANMEGMDDPQIERVYKFLCEVSGRLKSDLPKTVFGFSVGWDQAGQLSVTPPPKKHEAMLLYALLQGEHLFRRCQRPRCKNVFMRVRRQIYCSNKCSAIARIRRHRDNHQKTQ